MLIVTFTRKICKLPKILSMMFGLVNGHSQQMYAPCGSVVLTTTTHHSAMNASMLIAQRHTCLMVLAQTLIALPPNLVPSAQTSYLSFVKESVQLIQLTSMKMMLWILASAPWKLLTIMFKPSSCGPSVMNSRSGGAIPKPMTKVGSNTLKLLRSYSEFKINHQML